MSLKESAESLRKKKQELAQDVRSTIEGFIDTVPRPVWTALGREPPLKRVRRRLTGR